MAERNSVKSNERISARQERVAQLVAVGRRTVDITRETGVSGVTIWRWKKLPQFNARVDALRHEIVDAGVDAIADLIAGRCVKVLRERLDARNKDTGLPIASIDEIKTIAETLIGLKSAADLAARLEALEAKAR